MSMSASNCASTISSSYNGMIFEFNDSNTFFSTLQSTLDAEFQNGTLTATSVDISSVSGSLNLGSVSGTSAMAAQIGLAVQTYWVAAVTLGSPMNCSSISTVTNDAIKIGSIITSNIESLFGSDVELTPNFEAFCSAIIDPVKTIQWTVVESGPECASTYTVSIS